MLEKGLTQAGLHFGVPNWPTASVVNAQYNRVIFVGTLVANQLRHRTPELVRSGDDPGLVVGHQ